MQCSVKRAAHEDSVMMTVLAAQMGRIFIAINGFPGVAIIRSNRD
jgi:hypothetical protein